MTEQPQVQAHAPVARTTPWPAGAFVGGALCLDFCNTVADGLKHRRQNRLQSFDDLVGWHRAQSLVGDLDAVRLDGVAARDPERATRLIEDALGLREHLHAIFSSVAAGLPPPEGALTAINDLLPAAVRTPLLVADHNRCLDSVVEQTEDLRRLLWPIVRSAAELLTGPNLGLLRECGRCSWLFLDRTRNRSRRWCRMESCGNRAKVQRYDRRRRAKADPSEAAG